MNVGVIPLTMGRALTLGVLGVLNKFVGASGSVETAAVAVAVAIAVGSMVIKGDWQYYQIGAGDQGRLIYCPSGIESGPLLVKS